MIISRTDDSANLLPPGGRAIACSRNAGILPARIAAVSAAAVALRGQDALATRGRDARATCKAVHAIALTSLPTVLLLGDSIRLSYQPRAGQLLAGRTEVVGPADNCRFALYSLMRV